MTPPRWETAGGALLGRTLARRLLLDEPQSVTEVHDEWTPRFELRAFASEGDARGEEHHPRRAADAAVPARLHGLRREVTRSAPRGPATFFGSRTEPSL